MGLSVIFMILGVARNALIDVNIEVEEHRSADGNRIDENDRQTNLVRQLTQNYSHGGQHKNGTTEPPYETINYYKQYDMI